MVNAGGCFLTQVSLFGWTMLNRDAQGHSPLCRDPIQFPWEFARGPCDPEEACTTNGWMDEGEGGITYITIYLAFNFAFVPTNFCFYFLFM